MTLASFGIEMQLFRILQALFVLCVILGIGVAGIWSLRGAIGNLIREFREDAQP